LIPYPGKKLNELSGFPFLRQYLYFTLDTYETRLGQFCGKFIFFLILISVVCYCLGTIPSLAKMSVWRIIDGCISVIFTVEYALRFGASRRKLEFIKRSMNVIDICSFLPFYAETILFQVSTKTFVHYGWFRVMRVLRLTKTLGVTRYKQVINGLTVFSETIILARHSLTMLLSAFLFCTLMLSAIAYSAEESVGTFRSIFEAMY